jgi:hypothetical protein
MVEGIPAMIPADLREVVAGIAADAAVGHVQRTLRVRPTPSRDDRRLWTKAAREALIAEAKRRKHGPVQTAASQRWGRRGIGRPHPGPLRVSRSCR